MSKDPVTDRAALDEIFDRGVVVNILPSRDALYERLLSGERLRIYIGADPTSTALHLSHAKNYIFLEELRKLGHEVVVLFGDFTAQIGDPTGREDTRIQLTAEQVAQNVSGWMEQIRPLLGFDDESNPVQVRYNSAWLETMSFADVVRLASNFTVQQMLERDMFEKRMKENMPIHLHEFLYPLMQGYDSVAMDVDVELCGTDQTFNALAGRTLMKRIADKEKFVIAVNLMEDPETGELMSKSRGTGVFLSSPPNEMFGAVMAQPDSMITPLYINVTRLPLAELDRLIARGPREAKDVVAHEIVRIFYGSEAADVARDTFNSTFAKGGVPNDVPTVRASAGDLIADILVRHDIVASKSEFRRLVESGAVRQSDGVRVADPQATCSHNVTLKVGKRRFVRIELGS